VLAIRPDHVRLTAIESPPFAGAGDAASDCNRGTGAIVSTVDGLVLVSPVEIVLLDPSTRVGVMAPVTIGTEIVAESTELTGVVTMVKVCRSRPWGTVTIEGGCASGMLEAIFTAIPPAGAGALSTTVPVETPIPPKTTFGSS
jgi:hypothetical protein